jgi:signal transduction histidine kinase
MEAAPMMKTNLSLKPAVMLILLISAGLAGNIFKLPLFFGVDWLFGSIATMLILYIFGLPWGILSAVIAGSATYMLWKHPYAWIVLVFEAVFVGVLLKRGHKNLPLLDGIFWTFIGCPLVYLFHSVFVGFDTTSTIHVMFKQGLNGIINALIAGLILLHPVPVRFINRQLKNIGSPSFYHVIFNLLLAFVLIPALLITVMWSRHEIKNTEREIKNTLHMISHDLSSQIRYCHEQHSHKKELVSTASQMNDLLLQFSRHFSMTHGEFFVTVIDKDNTVIATNKKGVELFKKLEPQADWKKKELEADLYLLMPPIKNPMIRWKGSFYAKEEALGITTWKAIYEYPAHNHVDSLYRQFTANFVFMYLAAIIGLLVSAYVSSQLIRPLNQLLNASQRIPEKVFAGEEIKWPEDSILEVNHLVDTFRSITYNLQQMMQRLKEEKELLETHVEERTKEIKEAQEELRELNAGLEQKVADEVAKSREKDRMLLQQGRLAAMGEMLGAIAHQWRQPLNALALIIQNILDAYQHGECTEEYLKENVAKGINIINHLSQTINDFRDFFKPSRDMSKFGIKGAVEKAISIVEPAFKNNFISVSVETAEDVIVSGYPNEFSNVILNVLNNAKDALLESGTKKPEVKIKIFRKDNSAVVTVTDNAGGIPEEIIDKVFDPYFTTKEEGKGTGIGLYMAKMIIERNMGGNLTVRNVDGGAELRI